MLAVAAADPRQVAEVHPIRLERGRLIEPFAQADHDSAVGLDSFKGLFRTVWPAHHYGRQAHFTQPEMYPRVALGDVIAPAANFVDLRSPGGLDLNPGSDGGASRLHPRVDHERVHCRSELLEERRAFMHVDGDDPEGPVVVEICDRDPARRMLDGHARTSRIAAVVEPAAAVIPVDEPAACLIDALPHDPPHLETCAYLPSARNVESACF